ncbi:OmpA family protein [Hoeflea sp. TYP-13]|uniref:OmpA family protein n=1 Tax=Hoeflea sp. TYP-13 TaxID=3230023 RepID=UPI0034C6C7AC
MKSILRAIAVSALLTAGLAASGCNSSLGAFDNDPSSGVTDDPAVGFAKFKSDSEEHFVMTVGRRVYFTSGSTELDDVALETLNLQAAWLVSHPKWLIKLQGFADDPGSEDANVKLSAKRAQTVMDYLASKGVNRQRMWAKGYGKERLVRNCADISCKSQNRRVIVNLRKEFDGAAPQYKRKQS